MAFAQGDRVGNYVIEGSLGSGGMGEVYRAHDERLNRTVAIKILLPAEGEDQERRARFLQEARSASALNHPNIITIYDIGVEGGRDYLVMEYLSGQPLDAVIPSGGLREVRAIGYAVQIASAMSAAHAAGIVHRDLKPANVMVTQSGLVKVLDFGLAKALTAEEAGETDTQDETVDATVALRRRASDTGGGRIVGTAAYMSPEQAEGGSVDARSDIFAFGCLFYEMLTGINPFRRNSAISSISAVLRDEPKKLRDLAKSVSGETERVVHRCLRKEPDRRFQSSADLKVVLQELKEESESGGMKSPSDLPCKPRDAWWRSRVVWGGAAAAIVVLAGAAVLYQRDRSAAGGLPTESLLVSLPGLLKSPNLSPDGNQVAFGWDGGKGGPTQLYVKVVGEGEPLRLTNGTEFVSGPVWSPDGTSIAFLSSNADDFSPKGKAVADPVSRVLVISALGGAAREIISYDSFPRAFSWSMDGRSVIVSTAKAVYAVSVESKERRKILDAEPNHDIRGTFLSPDGHTLALIDAAGQMESQIQVVRVGDDGSVRGEPRVLPISQKLINSVAWTPDSRSLIFGGSMSLSTSSLWRIPLSGDHETRLSIGESGRSPSIAGPSSRHEGRMVYMHQISDTDIWKVSQGKGRSAAGPLIASTKREWDPRYSPDGKRILFSSDRSGLSENWLANSDGFETTQLTNMKGNGTAGGRWSPDGRRVVFLSKTPGQSEIYTVDAQGGVPVRITNHPAHDTAPAWSPDGRWIYFTSDRSGRFELWKTLPEENAEAVQVTHNGGYSMIFAPDGKAMYYSKNNPSEGIWKQVLVNGEPSGEETCILPIHLSNWGNFDVSRDGIVYVPVEQETSAHIYFYRFADGSTTKVGDYPGEPDFGVSISPADGSILFSQVEKPRRELVLVENIQ